MAIDGTIPTCTSDRTTDPMLATDLFYSAVKEYIDYNKPDPIARRQLESWRMIWSKSDVRQETVEKESDSKPVDWSPKKCIRGVLEIQGDYIIVKLGMECFWSDGDVTDTNGTEEDGRLSYTCRLISGRFIDKKDGEEKSERKIRKKMISRLRQDSYITKLFKLGEGTSSTELCLAQAKIYVNASKFELEERVDVSEVAAETLRRALWSSTSTSIDIVEVILALPSLPCQSTAKVSTTTRLANRAKLRLLEDAMLDECEKEGDDEIIEDLTISKPTDCSGSDHTEQKSKKHRR